MNFRGKPTTTILLNKNNSWLHSKHLSLCLQVDVALIHHQRSFSLSAPKNWSTYSQQLTVGWSAPVETSTEQLLHRKVRVHHRRGVERLEESGDQDIYCEIGPLLILNAPSKATAKKEYFWKCLWIFPDTTTPLFEIFFFYNRIQDPFVIHSIFLESRGQYSGWVTRCLGDACILLISTTYE